MKCRNNIYIGIAYEGNFTLNKSNTKKIENRKFHKIIMRWNNAKNRKGEDRTECILIIRNIQMFVKYYFIQYTV